MVWICQSWISHKYFQLTFPQGHIFSSLFTSNCHQGQGEVITEYVVNVAVISELILHSFSLLLSFACADFSCAKVIWKTLCNLISFTCLKEELNKWNGRIWKISSCDNFSNCTGDNNKHRRLNVQQEAKICFWIYLIFSFVTHVVSTNNRLMLVIKCLFVVINKINIS